MSVEIARWQSTELATPHASDLKSLHPVDGPKEVSSNNAEVSASHWYRSRCDAAKSRHSLCRHFQNPEYGQQVVVVLVRRRYLEQRMSSYTTACPHFPGHLCQYCLPFYHDYAVCRQMYNRRGRLGGPSSTQGKLKIPG